MKLKNIPGDIKAKSIKEAQNEIELIIKELEDSKAGVQDSLEQYKRMMQLNHHIQEEFKKKAKAINNNTSEKKLKK